MTKVYFVAPEQDVIGDGENFDMWVAADNAQQAADLFAEGLAVEIDEPIRIFLTEEIYSGPPRMLSWDGRRDLHAAIDWSKLQIEHATPSYRYPDTPGPA